MRAFSPHQSNAFPSSGPLTFAILQGTIETWICATWLLHMSRPEWRRSLPMDRTEFAIEKASQHDFVKFFGSLIPPGPNTLRLFERNNGEYYTAHGNEAQYVAREFYKTTSVLKSIGSGPDALPTCTLSKANFDSVVSDALQNRQMRVQVYGQADTRSKSSSWTLIKEASPGNYQALEDCMNDVLSDPILVAVLIEATASGAYCVGVGTANAIDKTLGFTQFEDNDLLTNLEALLVQLGAKECVLPDPPLDDRVDQRVQGILGALNVIVTRVTKLHFKMLELAQLEFLLSPDAADGASPGLTRVAVEEAMCKSEVGAAALRALITYLDLVDDSQVQHAFVLIEPKPANFMRLDAHAMTALDLMGDGARKPSHLYGLLNKTVTGCGARLLQAWIRQPLANPDHVQERLDCVEAFVNNPAAREAIRSHLGFMPDMRRLSKKLGRGRATLQDVVVLYEMALRLPEILPRIQDNAPLANKHEQTLVKTITALEPFTAIVAETIDLQAVENRQYLIKAEFDQHLKELKDQMEELENEIRPEIARVASELQLELNKVLKVENNTQYGYHFRVSRMHAHLLRSKEFIELQTIKAGVMFTTLKMRSCAAQILDLNQSYHVQQRALVKDFMTALQVYIPYFHTLNDIFGQVDVLSTFAHVSIYAPIPYTRPTLNSQGILHLPACRHACIEVQDGIHYIPNNVDMVRGQSDFVVITGPNMGGKSSYCRAAVLAIIMAQIGCFVPCNEGANIPVFDAVLCRIGASDNQMRGTSTFMAEMLEAAALLRAATDRSMVIVDELGRGTSTHDGFGLAWAIAHYLTTKIQAFALFATHFHELTYLADELPNVRNLHVVAHVSSNEDASSTGTAKKRDITLLYKVAEGACDESFGIHAAEMAGLPPSVVALARRKGSQLEQSQGQDRKATVPRSKANAFEDPSAMTANGIAARFLGSFKEIDLDAPDAREQIKRLKTMYEPEILGNHYLADMISEYQATPSR